MQKTPEQWLEETSHDEKKSGVFKLFLGYAPGVGKTYAMLSEAIRRQSRGEDVVIGVVETHGRKATQELVSRLEAVPRRKIDYKGTILRSLWWTNWRIPTSRAASITSATRTSSSCSTTKSMLSPP